MQIGWIAAVGKGWRGGALARMKGGVSHHGSGLLLPSLSEEGCWRVVVSYRWRRRQRGWRRRGRSVAAGVRHGVAGAGRCADRLGPGSGRVAERGRTAEEARAHRRHARASCDLHGPTRLVDLDKGVPIRSESCSTLLHSWEHTARVSAQSPCFGKCSLSRSKSRTG